MNKKTFITIVIVLLSAGWLFAQSNNERGERNERSGPNFGQISERLQQEMIA